jgi:hypothetical protein
MPASARFKELKKRLRELRTHMLPGNFSPTGDYSDRQLDRARGYRLLVHAEIEAFIEDVTFEAATKGVSEWTHTQKVSDSLFCLMVNYHHGFKVGGIDDDPPFLPTSRPKAKEEMKEVVDVAIKQYRKIQDDNHGVREENLLRLILPVGVRKDDLDALWITNLNEFGKRRGDVAHKAVKAQQQIDPRNELQVVDALVVGLKKLDQLIIELK